MAQKFDQLIEQIGGLTLLELSELVKALEEKFGVSAAVPMASGAAAAGVETKAAAEEKTEFKVELLDAGADKIKVIKALRTVIKDLTLGDAKAKVEGAPIVIAEGAKKEDADKMKHELEAAGAKVKLS